jgi:outer membrane lipoprotein SlyB
MKSNLPLSVLVGVFSVVLAGCTFPSSRRTVPNGQANVLNRIEIGTVTHVRAVNIEGQKSSLGTFGGGIVGGAAASGGSGVSGAVVRAGGAVVGAVAGQAVEEVATRKTAQEITVRLDDGSTVVVTQESSSGLFQDGDRVRILNGGGYARVAMDTGR